MRLSGFRGGIAYLVMTMALFGLWNSAEAVPIPFSATLTGEAEVPGPGDPDGTGFASIIFDDEASTVDWDVTVANIGPVIGHHIHVGPPGTAGPIVIDFEAALSGSGLAVPSPLLSDILANPGNYYVNVHTPEFPAGAVRGQLVEVTAVPEPAAVGLLGVGLAALVLMVRTGRPSA